MSPIVRRSTLIILILLMPALLWAQARLTGGDLQGTVRDNTGAVLPGVTITATHAATNQSRTAVTDGEGKYYIGALAAGVYSVHAELSGFAPATKTDVRLLLGQRLDLDFELN